MTNVIHLTGCRPEPLLSYLKALGIFRLVAEQADPTARAAWEDDVFVLHTVLTESELVAFFQERYMPTPIVVPWSSAFFVEHAALAKAKTEGDLKFSGAPTEGKGLTAFLATDTARLKLYRDTITVCLETLRQRNILTKAAVSKRKPEMLEALRSELPDDVVPWLDVAFVLDAHADKPMFNSLLGSGGGSDGRANFADNFMQNLWDVLPDFDNQRKSRNTSSNGELSIKLLHSVLFSQPTQGLLAGRTSALFDSGALGGANATQGMERNALTNPWNFIFGLEGALCMAGAASRRLNANRSGAAFPFTVRSRAVGTTTFSANKESGQWEVWLPLWARPATLAELTLLFAEGRAEVKRKAASDGVDFSRAIASYGVDRGITAFTRYAIVRGRIGGDKYNTAAALGQFVVAHQPGAELLNEIDGWLSTARRVCDSKDAPARFRSTMRQLDNRIMEYCRYGGNDRFTDVLCALGRMERELGRTGKKPGNIGTSKTKIPPVPPLSWRWLKAADDGSPEFRLAVALASIQGAGDKLGAVRVHLEPVSHSLYKWDETSKMVVWTAGDLARNLAAVLDRRLMEAERNNIEHLPLEAKRQATPSDVAAFIAGAVDDERLEDLLWGTLLINWHHIKPYTPKVKGNDLLNLPRVYALLKLLYLPKAQALPTANGRPLWPEASILAALRSRDVDRALEVAARRLRAAGHMPLAPNASWSTATSPTRLAAALLIPLALPSNSTNLQSLSGLDQLVIRPSKSLTE